MFEDTNLIKTNCDDCIFSDDYFCFAFVGKGLDCSFVNSPLHGINKHTICHNIMETNNKKTYYIAEGVLH